MLIHDALVERHKMFFYYSGTVHVNTQCLSGKT